MRFVFTWLPCWSKKHHYSGVYRGSKFMHFDKSCVKMSQNYTSNLDKVFLNVPPSSDFGLEARILQIGWFYRPKWKKVEKSASKNKHPIKWKIYHLLFGFSELLFSLDWHFGVSKSKKRSLMGCLFFGADFSTFFILADKISRSARFWPPIQNLNSLAIV